MELTVRDVRLEDAEAIARILNAIIVTRRFSALDTPVTIEQERELFAPFRIEASSWSPSSPIRRSSAFRMSSRLLHTRTRSITWE